jgi:hypothetical protein
MALTYFLPVAAGLVGNANVEVSNAIEGLAGIRGCYPLHGCIGSSNWRNR